MLLKEDSVVHLERVALNSVPVFDESASYAVPCGNLSDVGPSLKEEIVGRYKKYGFVVLELSPKRDKDFDPRQLILDISEKFEFGEPFIPPLYTQGDYKAERFNRISVECNGAVRHPSFERTRDLPLHCDGTLQPIGMVKTSVLFCDSKAPTGGETVLFNAAAAFAELANSNMEAALALMAPEVLKRTANINGSRETLVGPAFKTQDQELLCCYSVADTDEWQSNDRNAKALREALHFMERASDTENAESAYHLTFMLEDNHVIFMDNTRISHGRKQYQNSVEKVRILYRGLFLNHPNAGPKYAG